jgi:hypothetical protein
MMAFVEQFKVINFFADIERSSHGKSNSTAFSLCANRGCLSNSINYLVQTADE